MPATHGATTPRLLHILALFLAIVLIALPAAVHAEGTPSASGGENLNGDNVQFFLDPNSDAAQQAEAWRTSRPDDAAATDIIATQPMASWFGDWVTDIREGVAARVTEIVAAGALPSLVAYNVPFGDCGQYSAGGKNDPDEYRAWIREFAQGISNRPAVVILEPDGSTLTQCLDETRTAERYALLADAVATLGANPGTDVYIDAGIADATGFSLNVSNFQTREDSIAFGKDVSDAIGAEGGTHFVIDASRTGNSPSASDDPEAWCNPPGRAIGDAPTVDTAELLVDAYLWDKTVGHSDGARRGGPDVGVWSLSTRSAWSRTRATRTQARRRVRRHRQLVKGAPMRWEEMEASQPRLAEMGVKRLIDPGVLLVGTIRKDGTPRISPTEPVLMEGNLWLSMMLNSTKARDLQRDERILVHNIVTHRDGAEGEFKIRGKAVLESRSAIHDHYAELVSGTLGWVPVPGKFHLFAIEIETVTYVRYEDGNQFITSWPPGEETVRRKETPTSLHPPETVEHLLHPD